MKTNLFFLILLFVIPFGCKEEKQIELVPLNEVYFPLNEVDESPSLTVKKEGQANKELVDLTQKVNDIYQSLSETDKKTFQLQYNFLVNEKGKIDKIQLIKSEYPQVDKMIAESIEKWEFKPAIKAGKQVKSVYPWSFDPHILTGQIPMEGDSKENVFYVVVEEMPEIVGGIKSIQEKIVYPELAKHSGIEGKVYALAFIDEKGNVADAKIIKGIGGGCDEAALDAVKQTKFIPGRQKGKPVKVQVSIPIVFKLQ